MGNINGRRHTMQRTHVIDSPSSFSGDEYGRRITAARLLFALLDAADDDALLRGWAHKDDWRRVRSAAEQDGYVSELPLLIKLMTQLAGEGRLDRSWILRRWNGVKANLPQA
jgi:hypothetical protein